MGTGPSTPPAALTRLSEADIVRICGLAVAAQGSEALRRGGLMHLRRSDARLEATIEAGDAGERPRSVWAEVAGAAGLPTATFGCAAHAPDAIDASAATDPPVVAHAPVLARACLHVAALLTAWVRSPVDFSEPATRRAPSAASSDVFTHAPMSPPAPLPAPADTTPADTLPLVDTPADLDAVLAHLRADDSALLSDILLLGGVVTDAELDGLAERSAIPAAHLRSRCAALERQHLLQRVPPLASMPTRFPAASDTTPPSPNSSARRNAGRADALGWRVSAAVQSGMLVELRLTPLPTRDAHGPPLLSPHAADSASLWASPQASVARIARGSPRALCLTLALLAQAPTQFRRAGQQSQVTTATPGGSVQTAKSPRAGSVFSLAGDDPAAATRDALARGAGVPVGLARLAQRVWFWSRDGETGSLLRDLSVSPPEERPLALREAFDIWAEAQTAVELADLHHSDAPVVVRYDVAHEALRPAALASEVATARRTVLGALAHLRPGVWYALDGLLDALWRLIPFFLRGRQHTYARPAWWLELRTERRALRPLVRDEWHIGDGTYVRALLTGPLHWFGAIDLASPGATGAETPPVATAFRITPFGAYLLHSRTGTAADAANAAPPAETRAALAAPWGEPLLSTRDGHLALQPLDAHADLVQALPRWAEPQSIAGGRIQFALSPDRACAQFDLGMSPESLLALIRTHAGTSGTQCARVAGTRLAAWHAAYGRTRIATGWTLVEARDDVALAEALAALPQVAARSTRVGPTLALVSPADATALLSTLARRHAR